MTFLEAAHNLPAGPLIGLAIALLVAFVFEFINGFHDTANAVATVIYTKALPAPAAVIYSGTLNFLGVLLGGTAVAFTIVHLLPVDKLVDATPALALLMVFALLIAGLVWNLGTWYMGLPVSSSHSLIGAILGVGLSNSLIRGEGLAGVNWYKALDVGLALLVSPIVGFVAAGLLLLLLKRIVRDPKLYSSPPEGNSEPPPSWIRGILIATCGGVSYAHGANDGQKGMGLVLLVLIGFLPAHYALNTAEPSQFQTTAAAVEQLKADPDLSPEAKADVAAADKAIEGHDSFESIPADERWAAHRALVKLNLHLDKAKLPPGEAEAVRRSTEFVPLWVVIGTAVALGLGTTVGYKRIMVTVAEKIGKSHLTYAQGMSAEVVAAATILAAVFVELPVSTTQVVSSGVAGTMAANGSGVQGGTIRKIALAWLLTLPATMVLAGLLFAAGRALGIGS